MEQSQSQLSDLKKSSSSPNNTSNRRRPRPDREERRQAALKKKEDVEDALAAERRAWAARKAQLSGILETGPSPLQDEQRESVEHVQKLQNENMETLNKTLRHAYEANTIADDASTKLRSQTHQLHRMDVALDDTQASLVRSERTIRGLQGWTGRLANWFTKPKVHKKNIMEMEGSRDDVHRAISDKIQRADGQQKGYGTEFYKDKVETKADSFQKRRAKAATATETDEFQDLTMQKPAVTEQEQKILDQWQANTQNEDQALDELHDVLKQLAVKAADMNKELTVQKGLVDHVDGKLDKTNSKMSRNNAGVKQILE